MYFIVNYDRCDRVEEVFYSFQKAKSKFKSLNDPTNTLEFYNKWYVRKILLGKGKRPWNSTYKKKTYNNEKRN